MNPLRQLYQRCQGLSWLILISLFMTHSGLATESQFAKYKLEWEQVTQASYYLIVVTTPTRNYLAKTKDNTFLLTDKPDTVRVFAFTKQAVKLPDPEIKTTDLLQLAQERLERLRQEQWDVYQQKLEDYKKNLETPAKKEKTPEEIAEEQAITQLVDEEKHAFEVKPYRNISLGLGVGKESLEATAGTSQFTGSAGFAQLRISLLFDLSKEKKPQPLSVLLDIDYHSLKITQQENFGTVKQETSTLLIDRSRYGGTLGYSVWQNDSLRIDPGIGVAYLYTTTMNHNKIASNNKELRNSPLLSLSFTLGLSYQVVAMGVLQSRFNLYPQSLGKEKNSAIELNLMYSHTTFFDIQISWYIQRYQEKTKYSVTCLDSTTSDCQSNGVSDSSATSMGLGMGTWF